MSNKILMIVSAFPPSGESGVQRPVKFLKYLAKDGWETYVVTPRKPALEVNKDTTLENEIPEHTKIFKTRSFGISEDNFTEARIDLENSVTFVKKIIWKVIKPLNDLIFPIDKQIGWVPFALFAAIKAINKYKIKYVYITASPYSAFICGLMLKKIYKGNIFWVADYRDAWQFTPMLDKLVLPFRYKYICRMDEKFQRKADFVVFTSPYVLNLYMEKFPWLKGKSDFITNGYDDDDFTHLKPKQYDKFTFIYMGKLHPNRGNPISWLKIINRSMNREFQYMHIGMINNGFLRQIKDEGLSFYNFLGYKSHIEALSYSAGADINVIVLNDDPWSSGVIPGKIFELLRLGKPILAIGPEKSVIRDMITNTSAGVYAIANNPESIKNAIEQLVNNQFKSDIKIEDIEQYSRQTCTRQLESIFQIK